MGRKPLNTFSTRIWKPLDSSVSFESENLDVNIFVDNAVWMTFTFRWYKIRKRVTPLWISVITPFANSFVMSIGIALTGSSLFGLNAPLIFFVHLAAYCLTDLYVFRLFNGEGLSVTFSEYFLAWLWQELSTVPVFLHTMATDDGYVVWRDKLCKLDKNGDIEQISLLRGRGSSVQSKIRAQRAGHGDLILGRVKAEKAGSVGESQT